MHPKLKLINSGNSLALALGTSYSKLTYHAYGTPEDSYYTEFMIPKKSGGHRVISSPKGPRKVFQRRLLEILSDVYEPPRGVHGFVRKRGIVSNAAPHVKALWVLNFDIKDFFPNIHFGRIYGLLKSKPYGLDELPARLIAHLVCHNKALPQGAPTSPVVANMVARSLDTSLVKLCRRARVNYSRYADDITISGRTFTSLGSFVSDIKAGNEFLNHQVISSENIVLAESLMQTISDEGFVLNENKTRLSIRRAQKCVTGLVVNQKVNVPRKFVRNNRAMLHAWEKYGYFKALQHYKDAYAEWPSSVGERTLQRVMKGRIEYVGQIRGRNDPIYKKQYDKLYDLERESFIDNYLCAIPKDIVRVLRETVWVISVEYTDTDGSIVCSQGTAFYVGDIGFLTCDHIFWKSDAANVIPIIRMHREQKDGSPCTAVLLKRDKKHDVALVRLAAPDVDETPKFPLQLELEPTFVGNPALLVAGFPSHGVMDDLYISEGKHLQIKKRGGVAYHLISARIATGNSGGPVINSDDRVVGIALRGAGEEEENGNDGQHLFSGFLAINIALKALSIDESSPR